MAVKRTSKQQATAELGASSSHSYLGFNEEEFLPKLRGERAIKTYQEMRENDDTVGAFLAAMEMSLRGVQWRVEAVDESEQALEAAEFVETCLTDMEHTFEDFIAEVLSFLPFGFSFFETVFKIRRGPDASDPKFRSQYSDGRYGLRKLAPRPQTSFVRFESDEGGNLEAFVQRVGFRETVIPMEKGLLFRTTPALPTGRSVLRNAYKSYWYLTNIQNIEAIAIERELNGLPVGRIPASYLTAGADSEKRAFKTAFEKILRDVKLNEQGYVVLPSDRMLDQDGNPTGERLVEFELMASSGTRAIDTGPVIQRYQGNIARTVLADFLMLGQSAAGSFALSKDKTDLFLSSLQGYLDNIQAVLNRHLIPRLWQLNQLPQDLMPKLVAGKVAPVSLEELGKFVQALAASGAPLFPDVELENVLREHAGFPERAEEDEVDLLPAPVPPPEEE